MFLHANQQFVIKCYLLRYVVTLPNACLSAAEWESIGTSSYRTLALNHAVGVFFC